MSAHVRTEPNTSMKWMYKRFRSMTARKANWAVCGRADEQEGSFTRLSKLARGKGGMKQIRTERCFVLAELGIHELLVSGGSLLRRR